MKTWLLVCLSKGLSCLCEGLYRFIVMDCNSLN